MTESTDREKLTELLLRPLAEDDPLRPVLRQDLAERLEQVAPPAGSLTAEQTMAFLRVRPPRKRLGKMAILAAVVGVMVIACVGVEIYQVVPVLGQLPAAPPWLTQAAHERIFNLPMEDTPVFESLHRSGSNADTMERVWRKHPDDPALYFGYLLTQEGKRNTPPLPADYEKTWRKIDPDNGMWALYQANADQDNVRWILGSTSVPGVSETVLALVMEAAAKPRLHGYAAERFDYLLRGRKPLRTVPDLYAFRMQLLNLRAPSQSIEPWEPLSSQLSIILTMDDVPDTEREACRKVLIWIEADKAEFRRASFAGAMPEIKAFTILLERWGCLAAAAIFVVAACAVALRRLPVRGAAGRLSVCLSQLRQPRDLSIMLALALPGPLAIALGSGLCTWGEQTAERNIWITLGLMTLSLAAVLITVGSHQVSRQSALLGLGSSSGQQRLNRAMCAAVLLGGAIWVAWLSQTPPGLSSARPGMEKIMPLEQALAAATGIWLLVKTLLGYTSPEAGIRHRLIASRLLPAFLITALVLTMAVLLMHSVERAAVRQILQMETIRSPQS